MSAVKVTQIGDSVGVILPKELLASMNVSKGDTRSRSGYGVTLRRSSPEFPAPPRSQIARVMKWLYGSTR